MTMNKKYIMLGIACVFIITAGFCYSLAYHGRSSSKGVTTSLSEEESPDNQEEKQQTALQSDAATNSAEDKTVQAMAAEITITGTPKDQKTANEAMKVYVHICGAVNQSGVYQAEAGARICDLIKMAGGLQKDAADDYINQAEPVTDGERIYIPTKKEVEKLTAEEYIKGSQSSNGDQSNNRNTEQSSSEQTKETSNQIDINTASTEELMSLPGIGQAKADSIIEYRDTNGKFQKIEDLMKISGIKEGLFNRISSYIMVK
jgi:competence protein ComEA